jgi:hypothetical protein
MDLALWLWVSELHHEAVTSRDGQVVVEALVHKIHEVAPCQATSKPIQHRSGAQQGWSGLHQPVKGAL